LDKNEIKKIEQQLIDLTSEFCKKHLNEEYAELSEKLIKKMGRKRSVPFITGKTEIWAAAVIHAIGFINFLFDKESVPYITLDTLNEYFGTNKGTVSAKAGQLKKMFRLGYYDPEFSTTRMVQNNPFNDIVSVDGFLVPISTLPPEAQEMVKNARAEGKDIKFTTK